MVSDNINFEVIRQILREINVFFQESSEFISTYWKSITGKEFVIILFENQNWLTGSTIIDEKKINCKDLNSYLLHFNLRNNGFKFGIDNKNRYILLFQYPLKSITSDILKEIFHTFLTVLFTELNQDQIK